MWAVLVSGDTHQRDTSRTVLVSGDTHQRETGVGSIGKWRYSPEGDWCGQYW